jgi:hypothetical protein
VNNLIIKGIKSIDGMKFHDIEGGFGEDKKSILVKEIAQIHGRELKFINQSINRNRSRFKDNVDIVDLKGTEFEVTLSNCEIYNQNSINASNNIYLLSERGYLKLLKILEDDFAWEQYEKLVDGYFNMRSNIPKMSKELQAIFMLDGKTEKLENEINVVKKDFYDFKDNAPLFNIECEELMGTVKKVATKLLGGYGSKAYNDKSLRGKVYSDIQYQLRREFGVRKYKAIKRSQLDIAIEIIEKYEVPFVLKDKINLVNNQIVYRENFM